MRKIIISTIIIVSMLYACHFVLSQDFRGGRDASGRPGRDGNTGRDGGNRGGPPGNTGGPANRGGFPGGGWTPGGGPLGGMQPGGIQPGGFPGGMQPGGGNSAARTEQLVAMLRSMDANGDGRLDPSEIPESRRQFVNMILQRSGVNTDRPINLADLSRTLGAGSSGQPGQSGNRGSSGTTSGTTVDLNLPRDPLVPYFGEKEEASPPVLAFGQRPQAQQNPARYTDSVSALSNNDQIVRSARDIMNRYDTNKNGLLDKDKGEWARGLPFDSNRADKNRDGRISFSELVEILGGNRSSVTAGSAMVSVRQSTPYESLPSGVPAWFFERDTDMDGQLTMQEYSLGTPWTVGMANEFQFLDRNNDGVATIDEIYLSLKEKDDANRLAMEKEQREKERRKGAQETPEGVVETPPPGQPQMVYHTVQPGVQPPQPATVIAPAIAPAPQPPVFSPGGANLERPSASSIPNTAPFAGRTEDRRDSRSSGSSSRSYPSGSSSGSSSRSRPPSGGR